MELNEILKLTPEQLDELFELIEANYPNTPALHDLAALVRSVEAISSATFPRWSVVRKCISN